MKDPKTMTDKESKEHAVKVHNLIQSKPDLKLLQDLVKDEADNNPRNRAALHQFIQIFWDFVGVNYDKFEQLKK